MTRSLFLNLFGRMLLAILVAVLVHRYIHLANYMVGALLVLLAAAMALWTVFSLRRNLAPMQRAANSLVEGRQTPVNPAYSDFDALARALAAASGSVQNALLEAAESRRELEGLLDSMQDAVVAVDVNGRIQWTNRRMQRLIPGATLSGAVRVGRALVQTVRDPEVLDCVGSVLKERNVCVRRSTSLVPGRIYEVNAAPMPGGGAVAVLHDITRVEEVERTQRDFVANVSHELRTPLTSITGYVETLLDHETLSPVAREFLSTILKNATRMNRLTEDLLVMARVESASQELHPAPVAASVLVQDAVKAMSGLVAESSSGVDIEIGEVTSMQVYADVDAVMQVLGNLIENAVKYGLSRGDVRSRVIVSCHEVQEPIEGVEFRVRDFGQGIAYEHLNRIFERFYRVDKTRSRESGGTGLGLAIARHIVQSQGGAIRAESKMNVGSTFLFTLPKALYPVS
ncbi:two-component system, OmpR family, phosphate regulon sensor histidine kinase PhoR [Granulicella rosea]|uniref:histidine kinase n=1 Tax=Granulicella rosea TaxID=474952 RepID=A0A239H0C1_9BACT|nr:ATP-binding protein [Granulicella rosea]SNS74879.1 two-component system, OmpR family, phosphate regulon sensor histidine kinase PhoR [Granulicella rosea]